VLIKNIGQELPNRLRTGKDIDILIKKEDYQKGIQLLTNTGFKEIQHPQSSAKGWKFAYGATECSMLENRNQVITDIFCELCVKSLMGNIWIPLDRHINEHIWDKRQFDEENGWWIMDEETRFVYMISRRIFDKGCFNEVYIQDIKKCKDMLNRATVISMLEKIFFKFTPELIRLVTNDDYEQIISHYIRFCDY
jgi:hypothetical protein